MLFQFSYPSIKQLNALIEVQKSAAHNYDKNNLKGFRHDKNKILLGEGNQVFEAAKKAMSDWAMFPGVWAVAYHQNKKFIGGDIVVMNAKIFGTWWLNTARILYVNDDAQHFGFAYGTLTHHAESGEELFQVRMDDDGKVWYEITAVSKPYHILARLASPVARFYQKKFVRQSLANVKNLTEKYYTTVRTELVV